MDSFLGFRFGIHREAKKEGSTYLTGPTCLWKPANLWEIVATRGVSAHDWRLTQGFFLARSEIGHEKLTY